MFVVEEIFAAAVLCVAVVIGLWKVGVALPVVLALAAFVAFAGVTK